MKALIQEIRTELEKISPKHLKITKKTYATEEEISDFEKHSGLTFPEDLIEFWLNCDFEITLSTQIYKTLQCNDGPSFFMMEEFEYLVNYRNENSEHGFDKGWFPIAIDSYDSAVYVDLNSETNGTYGQLLYMMYVGDGKSGSYDTGFKSFKAYLEHYLHLLKERKIDVEEHIIYPLSPF